MLHHAITPEGRIFLLISSQPPTLVEAFWHVGPGGTHHLRGHQPEGEIPPQVLQEITAFIEERIPGTAAGLTTLSTGPSPDLPAHLILASADRQDRSLIIHYPSIGFTAGLREDGTKIPPTWKDPAIFTPEQRSHFLHQAADTLMQAIANHRQAT